jgi:zinc transport system permease protein
VIDFFNNPFLVSALLAGFAASITSGVVGSYVVVKRIVFISGSISHSVLGGMGLCLWLQRAYHLEWATPLFGALFAALASAYLIGLVHLRYREREDTVIAALWATGMSLGVIFIALTPGYNVELMNYLFGNILWVTRGDLLLILGLDAIVLLTAMLCHRKFLAICFDEQQAALQNVNVKGYYLLLLALVALSVVLLIQIVGAILIIALLAIPAAIATTMTARLSRVMGLAVLFSAAFTLLGVFFAYELNWPPGATIALTAALFYLLNFAKHKRIA